MGSDWEIVSEDSDWEIVHEDKEASWGDTLYDIPTKAYSNILRSGAGSIETARDLTEESELDQSINQSGMIGIVPQVSSYGKKLFNDALDYWIPEETTERIRKESEMVNQQIQENLQLEPYSAKSIISDVGSSYIPMILGMGVAGPLGGLATAGIQETGDQYYNLKDKGVEDVAPYALGTGVVSSGLELLPIGQAYKATKKGVMPFLGKVAKTGVTEGVEEVLQGGAGAGIESLATGKAPDNLFDRTIGQFPAGALGGGLMGAMGSLSRTSPTTQTEASLVSPTTETTVENETNSLVQEALLIARDLQVQQALPIPDPFNPDGSIRQYGPEVDSVTYAEDSYPNLKSPKVLDVKQEPTVKNVSESLSEGVTVYRQRAKDYQEQVNRIQKEVDSIIQKDNDIKILEKELKKTIYKPSEKILPKDIEGFAPKIQIEDYYRVKEKIGPPKEVAIGEQKAFEKDGVRLRETPVMTPEGEVLRVVEDITPQFKGEPTFDTYEIPLAKIKKAPTDFKKRRTKPLTGKFDRRGVGPVALFEPVKTPGVYENYSGRHREALARQNGEVSIPAQIYREADGYTREMMESLDAEFNIRDNQGDVYDVAEYIKKAGLTEQEAENKTLLRSHIGRQGFDIATKSIPDVYTLFANEKLSVSKAATIANYAPNNEAIQRLALLQLQKNPSLTNDALKNILTAYTIGINRMKLTPQEQQMDLFGSDPKAKQLERDANLMNKNALRIQASLKRLINAAEGALQDPANAAKFNLVPQSLEIEQAKLDKLKQEYVKYQPENWRKFPEVIENLLTSKVPSFFNEEGINNIIPDLANGLKSFTENTLDNIRGRFGKEIKVDDTNGIPLPEIEQFLNNPLFKDYREAWIFNSTLADKDAEYVPVFESFKNKQKTSNINNAEFLSSAKSYWDLEKQSQNNVLKVLEEFRLLQAQNIAVDESFEGLLKKGLNKVEIDGYNALRKTYRENAIKKMQEGFILNPPNHIKKLRDNIIRLQSQPQMSETQQAELATNKQGYQKYISDVYAFTNNLANKIYTPFTRQGTYFVYAPDYVNQQTGQVGEFYLFEKPSQAREVIEQLKKSNKDLKITHGPFAKETSKYDRYQDMSIELQATLAEQDPDALDDLKTKLKFKSTLTSGFLKHLQRAKFVGGQSSQLRQAVPRYFTSLAKWHSDQKFQYEFDKAYKGIDPKKITLRKMAESHAKYMLESDNRVQKGIKQYQRLMNLWFLTKPASAIYNGTQSILTTLPKISYYLGDGMGGLGKVGGAIKSYGLWTSSWDEVLRYQTDKNFNKKNPELAKAIREEIDAGIITAEASEALSAFANDKKIGGIDPEKTLLTLFNGAEYLNRLHAFISGFKIAELQKLDYQAKVKFAEKFVDETQFIYGKANVPQALQGKLALPGTYQKFQGNYLRFLRNNLTKESIVPFLQAMLHAGALGGVSALPFAKIIFKAIESFTEEDPKRLIRKELPSWAEDSIFYGLPSNIGMNLSSGISSGDFFPDLPSGKWEAITRLLLMAASDIPIRAAKAAGQYSKYGTEGFLDKGIEELLPQALRGPLRTYKQSQDGERRNARGQNMIGPDIQMFEEKLGIDVLPKGISSYIEPIWQALGGYTPSAAQTNDLMFSLSKLNDTSGTVVSNNWKPNYNELVGLSLADSDEDRLIKVLKELEEFNANAPDYKKKSLDKNSIENFKKGRQMPYLKLIESLPKKARPEAIKLLAEFE